MFTLIVHGMRVPCYDEERGTMDMMIHRMDAWKKVRHLDRG